MKIGDGVYVHGYVDEIRKDTVIIRNNGGYFGTVKNEIVVPFAELATNLQQSCNQLATDCISRQAAIDVIKRLHDVAWANWKETRISANTMIDALKDLPSAQPEPCEDTISRIMAIDALIHHITPHDNGDGSVTIGVLSKSSIKDILNKLPSAQPEIIRCKDCKYMTEHYDTDGNAPYWTCSEWDSGTDYDGFCHYAERKNNV